MDFFEKLQSSKCKTGDLDSTGGHYSFTAKKNGGSHKIVEIGSDYVECYGHKTTNIIPMNHFVYRYFDNFE